MPTKPPIALGTQLWTPGTGQDPAKYLVDPGHWDDGAKRMTPGDLMHARPWIDTGRRIFVWPIPTEGFSRTGTNQLGLHHYIGDQYVDAQIIHRDEARIVMNGVFPGASAQESMVDFIQALNDDPPDAGMVLNVPGVFDQVKFVVPETWEFNHDTDDQTHSISYTVTFVVIGDGRRVPDPAGEAPVNPDTFPGAQIDYGPPDPWQIRLGLGAQNQPGNDFFFGANWAPATDGGAGGDGGGGGGATSDDMRNMYAPGGWGAAGDKYGHDGLVAAAWAMADQRGWYGTIQGEGPTPEGVQLHDNGQLHTDEYGREYFLVKFGTPEGNSTEKVYPPPPGSQGSSQGGSPKVMYFTKPSTYDSSTITTDNARTLRHVADAVYGNERYWDQLYVKNQMLFDAMGVARYEAPTAIMPVGIPLIY